MKRYWDNVVYDTEGEGVAKVAEYKDVKLYRGKNGGWFFEVGALMPVSENGAYRWLLAHDKTDALNKYFPLTKA